MSPYYQAFGLNIYSRLIIPMLPIGGDGSDLVISQGKIDGVPGGTLFENKDYTIGARELLARIPGVGEILMREGKEIIVNPVSSTSLSEIYSYVLGLGISTILYQRGDICLHGSIIKAQEQAILIAGKSGAGKSTVASVLCSRGYPFLTDDTALIRVLEDRVFAYSSYPYRKLWQNAIDTLNIDSQRTQFPVAAEMDKYNVCYQDLFSASPLELSTIFYLKKAETETVQVRELFGIDKMEVIVDNTYGSFLVNYCGLQNVYFDLCSVILDKVKMYEILRPMGKMVQEQIADTILQQL